MKKLLLPLLIIGAFLTQAQTVLYVNGSVTASGSGTSWDQAFQFLDEAFVAAEEGDEIWVAMGTYIPGGAAPDRTTWLSPTGNFQLYGGFQGTETDRSARNPQVFPVIIDGDVLGNDVVGDFSVNVTDNLNHLMLLDTFITNATIIDGITFTRGVTDDVTGSGNDRRGGAILSLGSPIIENCTFTQNFGWFGGGAYPRGVYAVDFKIRNSRFTANGGGSGGAMYVVNGQTLEITSCIFEDNSVENSGGALRIQDTDDFLISDCSFERNQSSNSGGAINFLRGEGSIRASQFISNTGNFGGAIANGADGVIKIDSCLYERNRSFASGGALSLTFRSSTDISNTLFLENSSTQSAGAIYIQGGENSGDTPTNATITDCTFELNEAGFSSGAVWARWSTSLDVNRTTFIDNVAVNSGGALNVGPDSLNLGSTTVSNSSFLFNASDLQGGAINILNADIILTNSVLNGNEGQNFGGGIMVNGADTLTASALIVNCTFSENESDLGGNEIGAFSNGTDTTTVQIQNSIFNNDNGIYSTEAGSPSVVSLGGNVYSTSAVDSIFTLSTDVAVANPDLIFVDTRDDLSLLAGSPAINVGINNANTPATDIIGFTRDALPDAGAYEFDFLVNAKDLNSGINTFEISPNPAHDVIMVSFNLEDQRLLGSSANMAIYDVRGTLISQQTIQVAGERNTYAVDSSTLISGNYIVQIVTDLGVVNTQMVKL